jgi:hypothetical protein
MKRWLVGSLAALSIVMTSACSITTDTDEVGLDYDYDMFSGTTSIEGCVMPGQRAWQDLNDMGVAYPASQRTFRFATTEGSESGPITVTSKDPLDLGVEGVATFDLNRDCKVLKEFHERIGKKYAAETADGWNAMLKDYVRQPVERALDAASKEYDWRNLYSGKDKQAWETKVAALATQFVGEQAGAAFFVNFRFTLQQPQPPEDTRKALASAQTAIEENSAQKNRNEQKLTELELIKKYKEVLGVNGSLLWQAIKDGRVTVVPVPGDGSVNVSPK